MTQQRISKSRIGQIAKVLTDLPEVEAPCSAYQVVLELAQVIVAARQRGHPLDIVVEALEANEIKLKRSTVARYLTRALREIAQRPQAPKIVPPRVAPTQDTGPQRVVRAAPAAPVASSQKGTFALLPDSERI